MKTKKYKIIYVDEHECHEWTLEEIIEYINRDRSNEWTDYDESDWREGWNEWVEPEGFYVLLDEDEYVVIDAEDGDDFQEYHFEDGTPVPSGTPVGIEYQEEFYIFSHIYFG